MPICPISHEFIKSSVIVFLFQKAIHSTLLHHFLARSVGCLLRIKQAHYVSKPLELRTAKDRLSYQSGKLKNDLLTLAEALILSDVTNDIVRLVWRETRVFDIIIPSKGSYLQFFISQHCVREKRAGFHQNQQSLDCSLSNEEQGLFFLSVQSGLQAHTHKH